MVGTGHSWTPKLLWILTAAMKLKTVAPWKKSCDKPRQCIRKKRHHFANKGHIAKAMVVAVVTYRYESWTRIKKNGHERIDAFELWC